MKDSKLYKDELKSSFNSLKNGEIIVMPTDTFYSLSCDPFNKKAVENLFTLKERDLSKPLPLFNVSKYFLSLIVFKSFMSYLFHIVYSYFIVDLWIRIPYWLWRKETT